MKKIPKLIKKRVKITKKGKMLRKKSGKAHGMAKLSDKSYERYKGYSEIQGTFKKRIKKIIKN
ncbi:50S ribosomal protein L35 [bacterium]|nr:50S ribosomal protein L35 [bacterium]